VSEQWKLKQSRNNWKQKAIARGKNERAQRKEINRIKAEREQFKQKAEEAKMESMQIRSQIQNRAPSKTELVYFTLALFLTARIGFRAISRVLKVLSPMLGLSKAPCVQTVINWVTRLAIVKTQTGLPAIQDSVVGCFTKGYVWLIDLSIGLGSGKILSVLALNLRHHQQHNSAPRLQDVECIAVSVAESWTGDTIADFLKKVIASVGGAPVAFLKDGGTDLGKAVRNLNELNEQGGSYLSIADISHTIANLFKHEYSKHPLFETFLSACGSASKKLKQTLLASLAPPKVSTSARFMNLHKLVSWADQLLKHSPSGLAREGSMLAKLRTSLDELPACKLFIEHFLRDSTPLLACQKILKGKGLNIETYGECEKLIAILPESSSIKKGFTDWAKEHLAVANTLNIGSTGLPISTDAIESLFGVGKRFGTGQVKDADRIALRLPVFCGTFSQDDAQKVIKVTVAQQKAVTGSRDSLTRQRRNVLPNPGTLETLANTQERQHVQLIKNACAMDCDMNNSMLPPFGQQVQKMGNELMGF